MDEADTEGTAEAEQAAAKAHDATDEPDDIMNALEAAEAKYDKAHPEEAVGAGALVIQTMHFILTLNKKLSILWREVGSERLMGRMGWGEVKQCGWGGVVWCVGGGGARCRAVQSSVCNV